MRLRKEVCSVHTVSCSQLREMQTGSIVRRVSRHHVLGRLRPDKDTSMDGASLPYAGRR